MTIFLLIVYLLSIPTLYFIARLNAKREDNKTRFLQRTINENNGSSGYRLSKDLRNRAEQEIQWTNEWVITLILLSFLPILNTFLTIRGGWHLIFSSEEVKDWLKSDSKL